VVRSIASGSGTGNFCIPLDLSNTGIGGVANGANVTIQLVYDGGDNKSLYQVSLRDTHIVRRMTKFPFSTSAQT
jgi:hypothetical protein